MVLPIISNLTVQQQVLDSRTERGKKKKKQKTPQRLSDPSPQELVVSGETEIIRTHSHKQALARMGALGFLEEENAFARSSRMSRE